MDKVKSIEITPNTTVLELVKKMYNTGFQGRKLSESVELFARMLLDESVTILLGYSASLSVAGQWKIIKWLIENNYIDILVSTGANISEDIIEAMGNSYYKGSHLCNDQELFLSGFNRYYDVIGKESDYLQMTEYIAEFILTLDENNNYSSREFLYLFGKYLNSNNINSILSCAFQKDIPVFCPAICDSPFGDASLIAKSKKFHLKIDSIKDYTEFMGIASFVTDSGVFYIGGGVPKDFIQLFAVTPDLLFHDRKIPNRLFPKKRTGTDETYYPHKYAIQITTDSPQWGGLSGCSFEEAISWGKESDRTNFIQCYCDATIALPIIMQAICEHQIKRNSKNINSKFKE